MRRWFTSPRPPPRSASASGAASWVCCIWRSCGNALSGSASLDLISTAPNVVYRVVMEDGTEHIVTNPSEFPDGKMAEVYEPVVRSTILTPSEFVGTVMELCQGRRGTLLGMDYLSEDRVEMRYTLPLAEIVYDFFDQLKSRTRGYASLDYEPDGEQAANLVKVDILCRARQSMPSARSCTGTRPTRTALP